MINIKKTSVLLFSLICFLCGFAQSGMFDEKKMVSKNLYKVKTNNRWGIVDKNDKLLLSIEYNEPIFINGKAVLTKYGSKQLDGIMDSVGNIMTTRPYYINPYYPFINDDMLAVREKPDGQWGFLNTRTGEMLQINFKGSKKNKNPLMKNLGLIFGNGLKGTFVFDFVAPFVEGLAVVYNQKTGWHHIDKTGQERFKNPEQKPTLFRTSTYKGECVIIDERGIVVCREDPNGNSGIMRYLSDKYEAKDYSTGLCYPYFIISNGNKLYMNLDFQADKYEDYMTGDSIIFIERTKIIEEKKEEPTDSFTLKRDIQVNLAKVSVSANSKGTAPVTLNISNIGEFESGDLSVSVNIGGAKGSWEGTIPVGATHQVTVYVPAKFSAASISREVEWIVATQSQEISGSEKVTIKRYKPSR